MTITMPNICGISTFQAVLLIEKLGLQTGTILYQESNQRSNVVLEQSIAPGEIIEKGSMINLTLSGINPIRYLPSIYRKYDRKNNGFLNRFLWIFQHAIYDTTQKLDNLHAFFNPIDARPDFFKWLASWFAVNLEYEVPEEKMRHVVKEAVNLYRWRGTAIGLSKYLEIISGIRPEIREEDIPNNEFIILDDKLVESPIYDKNVSRYNFVVSFPVKAGYFDVETLKKINQVIRMEKPAHTHYYITFEPEKEKKSPVDYSIIGVSEFK